MRRCPNSLYDTEAGQTLRANDLPLTSLQPTATDADNDVMAYRLVTGVSHGVLSLRADGTFEYTPQLGFVGSDSFEYLVTDGLSEFTRQATIRVWASSLDLLGDRMRQIVLALHNFHDVNQRFGLIGNEFNRAWFDAAGNPKLSWRVYILPYLGYSELFSKFHLGESWNSTNNLPLLSQMPAVFRSPGDATSTTATRFQTISDMQDLATGKYLARRENSYFDNLTFARLSGFVDGWSHSILFLQTGSDVTVSWTAPLDVDHDPANPFGPLGNLPDGRLNLAMADGARISLSTDDITPATFNGLVTIAGGELIDAATLVRQDCERHAGPRLSQPSTVGINQVSTESTSQNLKQLGLGLHNFNDTFSRFPVTEYPISSFDASGKPYLSWRVYLLPYLGYSNLYNQFRFNEPWNSPNNLPLLNQMPEFFRSPGDASTSHTTRMQVLTGPDALFGRDFINGRQVGPRLQSIIDGTSNTIMVAEVGTDRAVPWTAPDDVIFDAANPLAALGILSSGELPVLLADGSVMTLGSDMLPRFLPALASRNGEEILDGYGLRLLESQRSGRIRGGGTDLKNQLKGVGLAFHNYHDVFNRFPTWNNWQYFDSNGRPFVSWRVHLLPYIDQSILYSQFRLTEPWDSPHNIQLLDKMPQVYRSRGDAWDSSTTGFQVFTGPEALFERVATGNYNGPTYLGPRIQDIFDGTSNTFLAVEAGESKAVPWTRPDDLEFDPNDPLGTMGLNPEDVFTALLADGSVRQISARTMHSILKALITPSGNEYTYANYQLVDSPQGKVRPGISVSGVRDATLVISEGKLGAINVVLDKPGNVTIDFSLSVGGVVLADKTTLTFTTANWNVPQALTLKAIDDDLIDGAESVVMTLSVNDAATTTNEFDALTDIVIPVFNVNDDVPSIVTTGGTGITVTEGAAGQVVSVSLSHKPADNVTISVMSADSTQATVNNASLTFTTTNWNTPQSVTVTAVNDVIANGTVDSSVRFYVTSSTDPAFKGLLDVITPVSVRDNEVPDLVVAITGSDTVISEDGMTDTISIKLAVQPVGNVVVNVLPLDSTEVLVSHSQLTFTPANWNTLQTITVFGVNDALLDGDQLSNVQFSVAAQSSLPYLAAAIKTAVVKTLDDESAEIILTETGGSTIVSEAGSTDTVFVRLSQQPLGNVVVRVTSATTTEVTVQNSLLTFTPTNWDQSQTVTVTGVDDNVADGTQVVTLTAAVQANSATPFKLALPRSLNVQNTDNETVSFIVQHSNGSTIVNESGTADAFTVALSSKPTGPVVVKVFSTNTNEVIVNTSSLTFTSTNWNTPQNVQVVGADDLLADGNQLTSIRVTVDAAQSSGAYVLAAPATLNVTTVDNELAALVIDQTAGSTTVSESGNTDTFNVSLRSKPVGSVVVQVTSGNITEAIVSPATLTFTPANWNQPQQVQVTGVDDVVADGDQSTAVTLGFDGTSAGAYLIASPSTVAVATTDNENASLIIMQSGGSTIVSESGTSDSFTVALSSKPTGPVVLKTLSGNTAEALVSPALLTFTAQNWNIPQTVQVQAVDDTVADGDQATSITLTVDAAQSSGAYVSMSPTTVNVTTMDDDIPSLLIAETSGSTIVNESGATDSFSVKLAVHPVGVVNVQIFSALTSEVDVRTPMLVFNEFNWNQPQFVTVAGVDDAIADGDRTAAVTVSVAAGSSTAYLNAASRNVNVTNVDNEVAAIIVLESSGSTVVSESGPTDTISVSLSAQPSGNVVIRVVSGDTGEATVSPQVLTFTASNWNTRQSVQIAGVDDAAADGDQTTVVSIDVDAAQSSAAFAAATSQSIDVKTTDDEVPAIVVTESGSGTSVSESGSTDTFTVKLSVAPTGPVTLNVKTSSIGEVSVQPTTLTFTPSNWDQPQSVTVTGVDDNVADGDQTAKVSISIASNSPPPWLPALPQEVNVRNADNELAAIVLQPTGSGTVVSESGSVDSVQVSLSSKPTGNVFLQIESSNAAEVTALSSVLAFTPLNWNVVQPVQVKGINDLLADGDQNSLIRFSVIAASAPGSYATVPTASISVTTLDDEVAGLVVAESDGNTIVNESGTTDTITVRLAVAPVGVVFVNLTSQDTTECTVSPPILTFDSSNWNIPQTVTVQGVDDTLIDGPQTSILKVAVESGASSPVFSGLQKQIQVTTADNEQLRPVLLTPSASGTSQQPQITWTPIANAVEYQVWVTNNSTGQNPLLKVSVTSTSLTPSQPLGIGSYTVWVRAIGPDNRAGAWSVPLKFSITTRVVMNSLPKYVPTSQPTFSWAAVPGAVKYDLWVNNRLTGQSQVIRETSLTNTSWTPTTPLPLGLYNAWVRAIDVAGIFASWSLPMDFYIATPPQLNAPLNPTFDLSPTFTWQSVQGAVKYDIFYREVANSVDKVIADLTGTSWTTSADFSIGLFKWWVRAKGSNGVVSVWSSAGFVDVGGAPLLTALLTSSNHTPLFQWRPVDGAVRYILHVNRIDVPVARVIRNESITATQFRPITALPSGSYRAWVQAISSSGAFTPWSIPIDFTVAQREGAEVEILDSLNPLLEVSIRRGELNSVLKPVATPTHATTPDIAKNPSRNDYATATENNAQEALPQELSALPCQKDETWLDVTWLLDEFFFDMNLDAAFAKEIHG